MNTRAHRQRLQDRIASVTVCDTSNFDKLDTLKFLRNYERDLIAAVAESLGEVADEVRAEAGVFLGSTRVAPMLSALLSQEVIDEADIAIEAEERNRKEPVVAEREYA